MTHRYLAALLGVLSLAATPARAQTDGGTVRYYHTDAVGSVRAVTDATGHVVAEHDYLPFGAEPAGASDPAPQRFAGKERDGETGMSYFGARYYASQTGRFTTTDPMLDQPKAVLDPQRWNRYAYALNNPIAVVDRDGREPVPTKRQLDIELSKWGYWVLGGSAVAGAVVLGGPTTWRAAVGCFLSPACQSGAIGMLEGAAGGAPTSLGIAPGSIERALASSDEAIRFEGETAQFLAERNLLKAFDAKIAGRQIDAIAGATRDFVVEMTTGKGRGKLAQAAAQAKATGLEVIIYGQDLAQGFVKEALRQGYRVARSPEELERLLREK